MLPLALATILTIRSPIDIDGHLDEAAWADAEPVTDFIRFQPAKGGPAPGNTEVRFLQDERALYVGIRVSESPVRVRARISPRERINADDQVGVYLDTFKDGRSGYIFYFNPLGIQQDIRMSNGAWNASWDAAFKSRGRVTEDGYEIEIAFPFRAFKYPSGEGTQDWGIILTRKIPAEGAKYGFPEIDSNHPRLMSQAGTLQGVQPSKRGSGMELIPALTAAQGWPQETDPPFGGIDPPLEVLRPSLDARLGITPDIGITAAVNPDFSQVESDVSDIRINPRFAFRFQEARPFFTDGSEFYQDRQGTLYSRSINEPLYGVKISGREGPIAVGALNALDRTPLGSFHELGTRGFSADEVADKYAENTVLRIRADAFKTGYVGVTFADKRILGTPASPDSGAVSEVGGFDVDIPLGGRWFVGGSSLQAWSSPDAHGWTHGQKNEASLTRSSGVGTGFSLRVVDVDEDFRNETGFVNQSGLHYFTESIDHAFIPSRGPVDVYTPRLFGGHTLERSGDRYSDVGTLHRVQIWDVHSFEVGTGLNSRTEADAQVNGWFAEIEWNGQFGAVLDIGPEVRTGRSMDFTNLAAAQTTSVGLGSTLRPTAGIRLDTNVNAQWLDPEVRAPNRNSHLVRNRLTWQFTRELGLRIIEEYTAGSTFDPTLRSSALLTWLKVPGTAGYIGYSETTDIRTTTPVDRSVFAKISVLLRP